MIKASMKSQIGNAPCEAEDTEEMFWLRQNDDYQSREKLGTALAAQYRFREAAEVWSGLFDDFPKDPGLLLRCGGAYLTIRDFEQAGRTYERYFSLVKDVKGAALPMGVRNYLLGDYGEAETWFARCLPCGDELLIAVIYWHCLCCLRSGDEPVLLSRYRPDLEVGHHTAYRTVVSVLAKETTAEEVMKRLAAEKDDLNYCIAAYGMYCILRARGDAACEPLLHAVLARDSVWPCIAYLAAWNDALSG